MQAHQQIKRPHTTAGTAEKVSYIRGRVNYFVKIKEADGTKVKVDAEGDTKIKNPDGTKEKGTHFHSIQGFIHLLINFAICPLAYFAFCFITELFISVSVTQGTINM